MIVTPTPLPPNAHIYLAKLYAGMVSKNLDLEQMRVALAKDGIKRNISQLTFDLEERYGFPGYAAQNPAPPRLTFAQLDKIEQAKAKKARTVSPTFGMDPLP